MVRSLRFVFQVHRLLVRFALYCLLLYWFSGFWCYFSGLGLLPAAYCCVYLFMFMSRVQLPCGIFTPLFVKALFLCMYLLCRQGYVRNSVASH